MPNIRVRMHIPFKRPTIAIVGGHPSDRDLGPKKPFHGDLGKQLSATLSAAGINKQECYLTNVFYTYPPRGHIQEYCAKKLAVGGKNYKYPAVTTKSMKIGTYIKPICLTDVTEYDLEQIDRMKRLWGNNPTLDYYGPRKITTVLDRLALELSIVKPNIIIALGSTATWALLGKIKITQIRGFIHESTLVPGLKVLPIRSPAAIQKDWPNRTITIVDCAKAQRESTTPEIKVPRKNIWINPSLSDLDLFYRTKIKKAKIISFDIETAFKTITCIGFSTDTKSSLVIPFFSLRNGGNYWPTEEEEIKAWIFVQKILGNSIPKVAHNGTYDLQYLYKQKLFVKNFLHDTMILQHSLQPEMRKSLSFLVSIYTDMIAWKHLRPKDKKLTKGEEE